MDTENLRTAFNNYANKATGQLESRMFVKLFKQAGLLNSKFTANDVDVIFVKHRTKGARTLDFRGFCAAINSAARALDTDATVLVEKAGPPLYSGTETLPVRLHDDKSGYTGVHAHGGPSFK